jgi:hypothetical protein
MQDLQEKKANANDSQLDTNRWSHMRLGAEASKAILNNKVVLVGRAQPVLRKEYAHTVQI